MSSNPTTVGPPRIFGQVCLGSCVAMLEVATADCYVHWRHTQSTSRCMCTGSDNIGGQQLSFGVLFGHSMPIVVRDYVYALLVVVSHFVWMMTSTPKHFTVHVYGFGQHKCAKVVLWRCCSIVACLWFVGIMCIHVCLSRSGRHCVYSRFVALCIFPRGPCSQLPGLSTFGCHDHQGAYIESKVFGHHGSSCFCLHTP